MPRRLALIHNKYRELHWSIVNEKLKINCWLCVPHAEIITVCHTLPPSLSLSFSLCPCLALCEFNNIICLHNNHIGGQLSQRYYKCKTETGIKNLYWTVELMFPTGSTTTAHTHTHTLKRFPSDLLASPSLTSCVTGNCQMCQKFKVMRLQFPTTDLAAPCHAPPLAPLPPPAVCRKRVRLQRINRDAHELFQIYIRKNEEWMNVLFAYCVYVPCTRTRTRLESVALRVLL